MTLELFWYGLICGIILVVTIRQSVRGWLYAQLQSNRSRWRPGRYFRFRLARVISTGPVSMYVCGGQILAPPYISGFRIVVPVTYDPSRVMGAIGDDQWLVCDLPDAVVPVRDISVCSYREYRSLDCDLGSKVVYSRPYAVHGEDIHKGRGEDEPHRQPPTPYPKDAF